MDYSKLKKLLRSEEGTKLDFKACLRLETEGEKKEFAKDVISIANSRGGRGYILFGIEDKTKRILGISLKDYTEEKIQQIIFNRSDPPIPVNLEAVDYKGKTIGVLTIYRSKQRPHQMIQNGAFYIRRGSTTDVARREEIANMFQEFGLMTYETVILNNVSLTEIDYNLLTEYFKDDELFLEGLGIIGKDSESEKYHPTIGGLLLFGKNPCVFLPNAYIEVHIEEKIRLFSGNIFKLLDDIEEYIDSICLDKNYPIKAVYEAIINAVVHRDYLDYSNGIIIRFTNNYIEIINPGAMVQSNKRMNIQKDNMPQRRNTWLYQRLLMADKKNRFLKYGFGIIRIKELLKNVGEVKMINIGNENLFKLILPSFKIDYSKI